MAASRALCSFLVSWNRQHDGMMRKTLALVLGWILWACLSLSIQSFTFDVDAHEEECFYEDLEIGALLTVEYQVIKGGFLDVDVNVCHDPSTHLPTTHTHTYTHKLTAPFSRFIPQPELFSMPGKETPRADFPCMQPKRENTSSASATECLP